MQLRALALLSLFSYTFAQQTCVASGVKGLCINTSTCSGDGGKSTAGLCPGAADIQCCTWPTCTGGRCTDTFSCGGTSVAGLCPGPTNIQCCKSDPAVLSGLSTFTSAHARQIAAAVRSEGLPRQACLCAITTALTEAGLRNYANSGVSGSYGYPYDAVGDDHDSVGLFQQRVEYYGLSTAANPTSSTKAFLAKLTAISGWKTGNVASLCQEVQVSAYPTAYEQYTGQAGTLCTAMGF